jgi:hypothetical protein
MFGVSFTGVENHLFVKLFDLAVLVKAVKFPRFVVVLVSFVRINLKSPAKFSFFQNLAHLQRKFSRNLDVWKLSVQFTLDFWIFKNLYHLNFLGRFIKCI